MEKKTIFLELPCELIERIDRKNELGDRSAFITNLLEKQLTDQPQKRVEALTGLTTTMGETRPGFKVAGEIAVLNNEGESLGRFDLNTLQGFENLARKIQEVSDDPVVRIRARQWL